jgi:DNA-directed RNA polymerase specialized sigma24 family protein
MAKTDAPEGAPTDTDELVRQLRDLYDRRAAVLDAIHRGPLAAERDAILLELCGFRGMQYTEAAELVGFTREGIARRVRPQLEALKLEGLTPFERSVAKVRRPLRKKDTADLVTQLRTADEGLARRTMGDEARDLLDEMRAVLDQLKAKGMSWKAVADELGVHASTIHRLRGILS